MMNALRAAIAATAILGLAACGGAIGGGTSRQAAPPRKSRHAQQQTCRSAYSQIGVLAAGWRTDFCRHAVSLGDFLSGGPGKDGIPAIDRPRFLPVAATRILRKDEPVIELVTGTAAKAYPLQILIWHEIVNDRIGGTPVTVTFCPLCNTAIVFDRRVGGRTLDFGTTGDLRNSDLVMYDRQTESWWQQFGGEALVGQYEGTTLRELPARIVSWGEFASAHPHGLVLTRATGFQRDYGTNPYTGYDSVKRPPFFPADNGRDQRLQPKQRVVLIERRGQAVAVPFSLLARRRRLTVTLAGERLSVVVTGRAASALDGAVIADSRQLPTVEVVDSAGKPVLFDEPFWFAVAAFRPHVVLAR